MLDTEGYSQRILQTYPYTWRCKNMLFTKKKTACYSEITWIHFQLLRNVVIYIHGHMVVVPGQYLTHFLRYVSYGKVIFVGSG